MERDNQRNKNESRSQEINSNISGGHRKKKRDKKHGVYLQEWLDKSCVFEEENGSLYASDSEHLINHSSSFWPAHPSMPMATSQRLFSAVSDPTVCHYSVPSVPLGYAIEPISLPMYSMYATPPSAQLSAAWRYPAQGVRTSVPTRGRPQRLSRNNNSSLPPNRSMNPSHQVTKNISTVTNAVPITNPHSSNADIMMAQEFTSLPPEGQNHDINNSHRRFSDPGLGPSPSGNDPSDTGSTTSGSEGSAHYSSSTAGVVMNLVEQVSALRTSNKQLFRELHNTRNELQALKLQAASWKQLQPDYQPGLLSELVREVRDAARIREDALLARVRHIMSDSNWSHPSPFSLNTHGDLSINSSQVPTATDKIEKTQVTERLLKIEEQLEKLQINNSVLDESSTTLQNESIGSKEMPEQLVVLEKDKMQLRCELQEALNSRKNVEAHAQKLERLVTILRKKINGLTVEEKALAALDQSPSSLETSESLASISSTGSAHSPQVTMSGPVTDL